MVIEMLVNILIILFFIISIYMTFKYKFVQLKSFFKIKKILKEEKSSYQSFMLSLASHLGTGNIVGISTALIYGGPGTLFWMWVFTLFSSIFSLMENTLAQIYKIQVNGENRGGSCFYISQGINKKVLAIIFAITLILTNTILFQPLQVNTISETLHLTIGLNKIWILIILLLFVFFVVFHGTKRIVKFSEMIVPVMSITYIAVTFTIILFNIKSVPSIFHKIFSHAFDFQAILGAGVGSCFMIGIKRSLFSNEAGLGTMPSISAMSNVRKPIMQGYVQTVGAFIDTVLMCSLTGFVILIYNIDLSNYQGVDLIIAIFEKTLGKYGRILSSFFMLTFATATVVSAFYLGESNLIYFTKENKKKIYQIIFKILFIIGICFGVFLSTKKVWGIVDNGMIFIGVLNVYAILKMQKQFKNELITY